MTSYSTCWKQKTGKVGQRHTNNPYETLWHGTLRGYPNRILQNAWGGTSPPFEVKVSWSPAPCLVWTFTGKHYGFPPHLVYFSVTSVLVRPDITYHLPMVCLLPVHLFCRTLVSSPFPFSGLRTAAETLGDYWQSTERVSGCPDPGDEDALGLRGGQRQIWRREVFPPAKKADGSESSHFIWGRNVASRTLEVSCFESPLEGLQETCFPFYDW